MLLRATIFPGETGLPHAWGADPLVQIDSLMLSNVSVGLLDKENHWEVTVFGRNLGDQFYYGGVIENDGLIG